MRYFIVLILFASTSFGQEVEWTKLEPFRNTYKGKSLYSDVINHTPTPKGWDTRSVTAHENGHGIHAHLRNKYLTSENTYCGLYIGDDKAVLIEEPKRVRLSQVKEYLPNNLRGEYFDLYLVKQASGYWDEHPLYLFDEWVCYVNDNIVLLEEVGAGERKNKNGEMGSSAEFVAYAVALGRLVKDLEPKYWEKNKQFRAFLKWHVQRSLDTHRRGYKYPEDFAMDGNYYKMLKGNKLVRGFLEKDLGMDLKVVFPD